MEITLVDEECLVSGLQLRKFPAEEKVCFLQIVENRDGNLQFFMPSY